MKLDLPKKILIYASATHILNDLYLAIFYPLLPFIADDLDLKYSQIGLIKTVIMGASSMLQFPAGLISDFMSEFWILSIGNIWVGLGVIGISIASSYCCVRRYISKCSQIVSKCTESIQWNNNN